jgi:hypothetical protein
VLGLARRLGGDPARVQPGGEPSFGSKLTHNTQNFVPEIIE